MLALIEITPWHWAGFIIGVLVFVALDLFVFHRETRTITFRNAFFWTTVCFVLAMGFGVALFPTRGREEALEFVTGYLIELSLSMDNVFVIALIFAYFRIPTHFQHRVLFWGILGALVMRGIMIGAGAALIARFHWMLYVFGAFLVFSGIKMLFGGTEGVNPEKNPFIRLAQKLFPVSQHLDGQKFTTLLQGRRALTPLALVLVMVETTDLVFALDSLPAIFAVTQKPFIIFTSNVFAILGLRSLYFLLAGAIEYFRFLKFGLSAVLVFIGAKMLAEQVLPVPTALSLMIVVAVLVISILASVLLAKQSPPPPRSGRPDA